MIGIRLVYGVVSLLIVSIIVFLATQVLPGDAAVAKLGRGATPEAVESFRELYHLNESVFSQYVHWLGHLLEGELGKSFATGASVTSLIGDRVTNSLVLLLLTSVIAIPLAIGIGIFTAIKHGRIGDRVASVLLLVISSLPEFVLGVALVVLLATTVFQLLPAVSPVDPSQSIFGQLELLVLPTLTLVLLVLPYIARTVRACMVEALESDYVTMSRLKGISERRVILRHALPNIAGPTFQVIAQSLAYLAGGIVVVESVFQYPGIGQAFVSAVQSRDIPVVQVLAVLLAGFYVFVNLLADVGTVAMTPNLRKGSR